METESKHAVILENAAALRKHESELFSEYAWVFVLHLALVRRIRPTEPRIAGHEDRRKPREKEIAEFAVMHEIEVGRIRDNCIDRRIRYRKSRTISVEDH